MKLVVEWMIRLFNPEATPTVSYFQRMVRGEPKFHQISETTKRFRSRPQAERKILRFSHWTQLHCNIVKVARPRKPRAKKVIR